MLQFWKYLRIKDTYLRTTSIILFSAQFCNSNNYMFWKPWIYRFVTQCRRDLCLTEVLFVKLLWLYVCNRLNTTLHQHTELYVLLSIQYHYYALYSVYSQWNQLILAIITSEGNKRESWKCTCLSKGRCSPEVFHKRSYLYQCLHYVIHIYSNSCMPK